MIALIIHALRVAQSVVREHAKKVTRSSKWSGVRRTALKTNPKCAACGSDKALQVHHIISFKHDSTLELNPANLIVLCMGPNECHLLVGHGDSFQKYNPYVMVDSMNVRAGSITLEEAKINAKKNAVLS